jgi:hypothetical protein
VYGRMYKKPKNTTTLNNNKFLIYFRFKASFNKLPKLPVLAETTDAELVL